MGVCVPGGGSDQPLLRRSKELLGRYAWYMQNSEDRVWPCGLLQPNDLGLFDMLGNVYEWCQERFLEYGAGEGGTITDEINTQESIDIKAYRQLRGGSFTSRLANVRSADRHPLELSVPYLDNGFRPSRTHP